MILLAWYWLFTVLLAASWYGMPRNCPVPPYGKCTYCTGTGDNAPEYMTVEVAGITNGTCSACNTYNGTFLIPINYGLDPCNWQYAGSGSTCGTAVGHWFIQVNVTFSSPNYLLIGYVRFNGGASLFMWRNSNGTSKIPCLELIDEDVAFVSVSDGYCGGTPTFTVTSGDAT